MNENLAMENSKGHALETEKTSTGNISKAKKQPSKKQESLTHECNIHRKPIEFYCQHHDTVACDVCTQIVHRTCKVVKISEIATGVSETAEFQDVLDSMRTLENSCDINLDIVKEKKNAAVQINKEAVEQLMEIFEELHKQDIHKLESIRKTSSIIRNEIQALREGLQSEDDDSKFILMKKATEELSKFESSLTTARNDARVTHYGLIPSKKNGISTNGFIPKPAIGQVCIFPVLLTRINIETQSDRYHCSVSGIELLKDHTLVVADNKNRKIKMYHLTTKLLLAELPLLTTPLAITKIDDRSIITTSSTEKHACLLSIEDKTVETINHVELGGMCQNVGIFGDKYLIAPNDYEELDLIDKKGTVLITFELPQALSANKRKPQPKAIACDKDSNCVYVALSGENKVLQMNTSGDVISQFEAVDMKYPIGIALGRNGAVYVCCRDSNNIFQLSRDLSLGHVILNEDHGLLSPWCITVGAKENVVCVGSYGGKYVQVFKI